MPRYREEDRERAMQETRRALLEAAAQEFARHGFRGANINRISQAAGFAKGTVYNYFASKRALMQALIQDTAEMHLTHIARAVRQEERAEARLRAFFRAGFDFVTQHLARAKAVVNNLYGPDAEFKEDMYRAYQPMFELVGEEIIGYGIRQSAFGQVDAASVANLVMLIYLGIASQVSPQGLPWVGAEQVADLILDGLRRGRGLSKGRVG
jgi:AcrR family transcriptional regulator